MEDIQKLYFSKGTLTLLLTILLVFGFDSVWSFKDSCAHTRNTIKKDPFLKDRHGNVATVPITSDSLSVCLPPGSSRKEKTCCTPALETDFINASKKHLMDISSSQVMEFLAEGTEKLQESMSLALKATEKNMAKKFEVSFKLMSDKEETGVAIADLFTKLSHLCLDPNVERYCPICSEDGFLPEEKKLCIGYCSGVLSSCFRSLGFGGSFGNEWKTAVENLRNFTLESDFLLGEVSSMMEDIPNRVERVMNDIWRGQSVAKQVVELCGSTPEGNTKSEHNLNSSTITVSRQMEEITTTVPIVIDEAVIGAENQSSNFWETLRSAVDQLYSNYGNWFTDLEGTLCHSVEKGTDNCWNGRGLGRYADTLAFGETGSKNVETKVSEGKDASSSNSGDINLDEKMKNLRKVLEQVKGGSGRTSASGIEARSTDDRGPPDVQDIRGQKGSPRRPGAKSTDEYVREGSGGWESDSESSNDHLTVWYPNQSDDEDAEGSGSGDGSDWIDDSSNPAGRRPVGSRPSDSSGIQPIYPERRKPPDHKISESHPGDKQKAAGGGGSGVSGAWGTVGSPWSCLLSLTVTLSSLFFAGGSLWRTLSWRDRPVVL